MDSKSAFKADCMMLACACRRMRAPVCVCVCVCVCERLLMVVPSPHGQCMNCQVLLCFVSRVACRS